MSRSLKICAQVESGTIVAGYSAVAPTGEQLVSQQEKPFELNSF